MQLKKTMNIVFIFNLPYLGDDFDFHCEVCWWASLAFLTVLQQIVTQVQGPVNDIFMQWPVYSFFHQIVLTQEKKHAWTKQQTGTGLTQSTKPCSLTQLSHELDSRLCLQLKNFLSRPHTLVCTINLNPFYMPLV